MNQRHRQVEPPLHATRVRLDPVVDRLTILCGAIVCWHFELLPRWALALLVARELAPSLLCAMGALGADEEADGSGWIAIDKDKHLLYLNAAYIYREHILPSVSAI